MNHMFGALVQILIEFLLVQGSFKTSALNCIHHHSLDLLTLKSVANGNTNST